MAFENLRNRIRVSLHARRGNTFGKGVSLMPGAFLSGNTVGEHVRIGADSRCFGVDIGDYVSLGPRVIIGEFEHPTALPVLSVAAYTKDEHEEYRSINKVRTVLGEDCWLGANVFVRKGCRIGEGAIVGAGAIVLKDVEPFAIVAGAPARLIRYRDSRTLPSERLK